MENDDKVRYAADLLVQLNDEAMAMVDFDRLKVWLSEFGPAMVAQTESLAQLQLLREDYIGRIGGMVKAIGAADRSGNRVEEALAYVESLQQLDSAELIAQYRKVSACFRDTFPASFNPSGRKRTSVGKTAMSFIK